MDLDENSETFVIYIAALEVLIAMPIHPLKTFLVQDFKSILATLQRNKAHTKIPSKYFNFADVFSSNLVIELTKNTSINKYAIELIKRKQQLYGPIYALSPVKLETLKTYIKTHLKTGFIQSFKSFAGIPILLDKKPDTSFCLYVDY